MFKRIVATIFLCCWIANPCPAQDSPVNPEDIPFDPDRGIIIPSEQPQSPPGTQPVAPEAHIEDAFRGEGKSDYQILKVKRKILDMIAPPETGERDYIDRQIDKQIRVQKSYLIQIWESYKGVFRTIMRHTTKIIEWFKQIPIVQNPPPASLSLPLIALYYYLTCFALMKIARTFTSNEWMAWIPVLQLIVLLKITERSLWSLIPLLIPGVNIIFLIIMFMEICEMYRKPALLGIIIIIPVVNIALLWYLANTAFD